jgi:uncharacterized membrane protein HdeD (DUF308 family)
VTTETTDLLGAGRRLLQREAARWWWVPLIAAVVWFVIAWLVLRADYTSLATVGVFVGVVLLVALVNEIGVATVITGGWRVAHIALGALYPLGALWGFIRPINTFFAFASVLGLLLFLQGVSYLIRGVALRDETPYWWLDVVSGGLLTLLAIWVSSSDRHVRPRRPGGLHPALGGLHGHLPRPFGDHAGLRAAPRGPGCAAGRGPRARG